MTPEEKAALVRLVQDAAQSKEQPQIVVNGDVSVNQVVMGNVVYYVCPKADRPPPNEEC
jgi:hypothetical protein